MPRLETPEGVWLTLGMLGLAYEVASIRSDSPHLLSLTKVLRRRVLRCRLGKVAFTLFWLWVGLHLLGGGEARS